MVMRARARAIHLHAHASARAAIGKTWYIGVMPVPAAIRVNVFLPSKGYCALILNLMCLKLTLEPTDSSWSHCDTAPPS